MLYLTFCSHHISQGETAKIIRMHTLKKHTKYVRFYDAYANHISILFVCVIVLACGIIAKVCDMYLQIKIDMNIDSSNIATYSVAISFNLIQLATWLIL